ncbi:unnamed protein product [Pseudo-nitzschia multistriata]|uniref:Uncharacterized protein n=1 Tax=Pseudo-nitzschia multistriata TaxID=183589 RepID=A0A448ZE11_9STRA|nr:unnamed protein product [Pseudo-nitzschia multistriata]
MFFQHKTLAAFLLLSSSPFADAQCYESSVCLDVMGKPGECTSSEGRTFPICCPDDATQTWNPTDVCTMGGDPTPTDAGEAAPTGEAEAPEKLCYEIGTAICWELGVKMSSCVTGDGREFNACCPKDVTESSTWNSTCIYGDGGHEKSAAHARSLETVVALGLAVATTAVAFAGF